MPNTLLTKSLHLCFSIIKRPQPQLSPPPPQHHHSPPTATATAAAAATFYNTLYEDSATATATTSAYHSATASPPTSDDDEAAATATSPDLTAVYASGRFFISYPGRSNSILAAGEEVAGGVPVPTFSPDPYRDFRRSMEEMVAARELQTQEKEEGWEYLQELLLSYLALNPKSTHKYIVGAFADMVISLLSSSTCSNIIINSSSSPSSSTSSSSSRDR